MANANDLTGFPINSVTIVVAYETKSGIEEVVHQVDGKKFDIVSVVHQVERKTKPVKDEKTKEVVAYEATGENTLSLKLKYIGKP